MKKNNQLVVVIVGVVIIIGAYYYFTSQPTVSTTPEVATTTATSTTPVAAAPAQPTATKYSNPQLGFSFMMPVEWTVSQTSESEVHFTSASGKFSSVYVPVNSGKYTLASFKDAEMKTSKARKDGAIFQDTSVNGEPAFFVSVSMAGANDSLYVIHAGYIYEIGGFLADLMYSSANTVGFTFTR